MPLSWVGDEKLWDKAKRIARKQYGGVREGTPKWYRIVTGIYKQAGGLMKKAMGGGEGSRGGHVIGHTRSGKPIYDPRHPSNRPGKFREAHQGWSAGDHRDASELHYAAAKKLKGRLSRMRYATSQHTRPRIEGHVVASEMHATAISPRTLQERTSTGHRLHVLARWAPGHPEGQLTTQVEGPSHDAHHAPSLVTMDGGAHRGIRAGVNSDTGVVTYDPYRPDRHIIDTKRGEGWKIDAKRTYQGHPIFDLRGLPAYAGGSLPKAIHDPAHGELRVRAFDSDRHVTTYHRHHDYPEWDGPMKKSMGMRLVLMARRLPVMHTTSGAA